MIHDNNKGPCAVFQGASPILQTASSAQMTCLVVFLESAVSPFIIGEEK